MPRKVFVSYRHTQADFVRHRLVPVLEAGGAEVLLDQERFRAGEGVIGQMDAVQDQAQATVVVLSRQYLESDYTVHEMERAVGLNGHRTVPIVTDDSAIPEILKGPDPLLRVDVRNDEPEQWGLLLDSCEAPHWQRTINLAVRKLNEASSVNLVADNRRLWKPFVRRVAAAIDCPLGQVDLTDPRTVTRSDLVQMILTQFGYTGNVPRRPYDLPVLGRVLDGKPEAPRVALLRFDMAAAAERQKAYGVDLFASLRNLMENRKLVVLAQSHEVFQNLFPAGHPMSELGNIVQTVELKGRPR